MSTSEDALVDRIMAGFQRGTARSMAVGLGDDAAVLQPRAGVETILTCDWFLEGSHFLRQKHPPDAVGWKCLARAASDIAAMGGTPRHFLLCLAIPNELTGRWLSGFLRGLRRASKELNCQMAGGDTTRSGQVLINVTVAGEIASGKAVQRSTVAPGDLLYVTGTLGEADFGLRILLKGHGMANCKDRALRKHLYPQPRFAIAKWLSEKKLAAAMIDISDGLSTDLARLCTASGVGARVRSKLLPVSALAKGKDAMELALHGGDDYELLFAVRPHLAGRLPSEYHGVKLTRIGEFTAEKRSMVEQDSHEKVLVPGGWDPFRK